MFSDLLYRLRSLFRPRSVDSEVEAELRFHMERQIEKHLHSGLPYPEAARHARIEVGGFEQLKEEHRDARGVRLLDNLVRDIRFGFRMLTQNHGFSLIAVLTLALGIGANTAIFSVVHSALIRPLPYTQPDRLITLGEVRPQEEHSTQYDARFWNASYPDYLDWTSRSKSFEVLAGFGGDTFLMRGTGESQMIFGSQVTVNFFSTLGVKPFLGRDFVAGEDIAKGPNVAILSYGTWLGPFGGDPHIIGRSIQLDDNTVTIVGVLPREFEFAPGGKSEIWVPLHISQDMASRRSLRWMPVIGRLAPSASVKQAQAEFTAITSTLASAHPKEDAAIQVVMVPLRDRIVGQVRPLLLVLTGAVAFVLLIACANVTNLFLVRTSGRRKEFNIRAALGAGRGRLISQLLAESMILASTGGVFGLFLAKWGTSLLIAAIPENLLNSAPFLRDAHVNLPVLLFLCAAVIFTGFAFGLMPALQISYGREREALNEEGRAFAGGARSRLRGVLVVAEIAFSLVLLIGSGLMVKSLSAILHRDPGFDPANLYVFSVNLPPNSYPKDPDALRFDREFTSRLRALPGIIGISSNSVVPLRDNGNSIRFVIEGQPVAEGREKECYIRDISNNYFSMMKIPLRAGRFFNDSADSETSPQRMIVNEAWARQYSPDQSPIGKRIRFTYSPKQTFREIVGVVGNTPEGGLDSPDEPSLFVPFAQGPDSFINYIVRTSGNPANAVSAIRDSLQAQDPQLAVILAASMDQTIAESPSVFLRRYPSYLIGSFAVLALILAVVGLYGLISYSVSQRRRELGIRIALGAQQSDILNVVLGEGTRLTLFGVLLGLASALALMQLMRTLLFGVSALDPLTFISVAAFLALIAVAACYLPARRAMRTDPAAALRYE